MISLASQRLNWEYYYIILYLIGNKNWFNQGNYFVAKIQSRYSKSSRIVEICNSI